MKAKITRKTTSEMVSPHYDNTESTTTTYYKRQKEKDLGKRKETEREN